MLPPKAPSLLRWAMSSVSPISMGFLSSLCHPITLWRRYVSSRRPRAIAFTRRYQKFDRPIAGLGNSVLETPIYSYVELGSVLADVKGNIL